MTHTSASPGAVGSPVSDDAIAEFFPEFAGRIRERLEMGKRVYGDESFERPILRLSEEILQEILDQAGWSFILYAKVRRMEERLRELEAAGVNQ